MFVTHYATCEKMNNYDDNDQTVFEAVDAEQMPLQHKVDRFRLLTPKVDAAPNLYELAKIVTDPNFWTGANYDAQMLSVASSLHQQVVDLQGGKWKSGDGMVKLRHILVQADEQLGSKWLFHICKEAFDPQKFTRVPDWKFDAQKVDSANRLYQATLENEDNPQALLALRKRGDDELQQGSILFRTYDTQEGGGSEDSVDSDFFIMLAVLFIIAFLIALLIVFAPQAN